MRGGRGGKTAENKDKIQQGRGNRIFYGDANRHRIDHLEYLSAASDCLYEFLQVRSLREMDICRTGQLYKMFQSASFWTITKNTLVFMVLTVPVTVIFGLIIAVLLDQKIKGKQYSGPFTFCPW